MGAAMGVATVETTGSRGGSFVKPSAGQLMTSFAEASGKPPGDVNSPVAATARIRFASLSAMLRPSATAALLHTPTLRSHSGV